MEQRTGTMEAVGQILPRLIDHSRRQSGTNSVGSNSVNVPATGTTRKPTHGKPSASSIADLRRMLQALGVMELLPDEEVLFHAGRIEAAYQGRIACKTCHKKRESTLTCMKLGFEDGKLNLRCGRCPRSRQVKARMEQKRLAEEQMSQLIISKRFRSRRFQNFRMFGKAADACRLVKRWTDE